MKSDRANAFTQQYLEHTFMSFNVLQSSQPVQNDEFDIIVTLLHNQVNIALRSSLERLF